MNYNDIEKELKDLPISWYPALLRTMVLSAIKKKVFIRGRIWAYVKKLEEDTDI